MPFDNNYTSTEVWLSFDEPVKGKRFMCGYIPHSQVVDYVNKAGHFVPPKGHLICIYIRLKYMIKCVCGNVCILLLKIHVI